MHNFMVSRSIYTLTLMASWYQSLIIDWQLYHHGIQVYSYTRIDNIMVSRSTHALTLIISWSLGLLDTQIDNGIVSSSIYMLTLIAA